MFNFQKKLQAKRAMQKQQIKDSWKDGEFEKMKKLIKEQIKKNPHSEEKPFT